MRDFDLINRALTAAIATHGTTIGFDSGNVERPSAGDVIDAAEQYYEWLTRPGADVVDVVEFTTVEIVDRVEFVRPLHSPADATLVVGFVRALQEDGYAIVKRPTLIAAAEHDRLIVDGEATY